MMERGNFRQNRNWASLNLREIYDWQDLSMRIKMAWKHRFSPALQLDKDFSMMIVYGHWIIHLTVNVERDQLNRLRVLCNHQRSQLTPSSYIKIPVQSSSSGSHENIH